MKDDLQEVLDRLHSLRKIDRSSNKHVSFNLPKQLLEQLTSLRKAFSQAEGKKISQSLLVRAILQYYVEKYLELISVGPGGAEDATLPSETGVLLEADPTGMLEFLNEEEIDRPDFSNIEEEEDYINKLLGYPTKKKEED